MVKKIFLVLFILIIACSIYPQRVMAGEMINIADNFLKSGPTNSSNAISETALKDVSNSIYNIFLAIGIIVAVGMAGVLGITYMTGSIEAQAKVKESLVPFVVGCIVVFGAFGIWKLVIAVGERAVG